MKNPGSRRQLLFKIERKSEEFGRKTFGMEFVKRATGISNGLRKTRNWTLWRGWPPPKWKIKDWALWRGRPHPKRKETLLAALGYMWEHLPLKMLWSTVEKRKNRKIFG
jgi:hypothetical protein